MRQSRSIAAGSIAVGPACSCVAVARRRVRTARLRVCSLSKRLDAMSHSSASGYSEDYDDEARAAGPRALWPRRRSPARGQDDHLAEFEKMSEHQRHR